MAAALVVVASAGCEVADDDPVVPADHPCPEWALTPRFADLWRDHTDDDPVPLAMSVPLADGVRARVSQGNLQLPTHTDDQAFAWDLAVPLGTDVVAAAPGRVAYVRDDSRRFGAGDAFRGDANFITIDHGGGLFSAYVHLAADSARVTAGARVLAGDRLAVTGESGQMTGPHLHFHVENVWSETLPSRFIASDGQRCDREPETDAIVVGSDQDDASLISRFEPSDMPPSTFSREGVRGLRGLPARLFDRDRSYAISGRADAGATDVFVLVLPADGGEAVEFGHYPVIDGRFSGRFTVQPIAPGRYALGATAVGLGDPIVVSASVRISVR